MNKLQNSNKFQSRKIEKGRPSKFTFLLKTLACIFGCCSEIKDSWVRPAEPVTSQVKNVRIEKRKSSKFTFFLKKHHLRNDIFEKKNYFSETIIFKKGSK